MKRFQFTIRSSLLAVVGLLCAAVVGLTSLESFRAWEQMGRSAKVAESNRIADLLLTSAGNWAVERGVVNAASRETGAAANRVLDVSGGLPRHARELAREVDVFIAKIRAA